MDAVDELARCMFYDGELGDAWEWCVEMLNLTDAVIVMMDGIVFVNNEVRDEHLELLDELPVLMEMWQDWFAGEAHVLAILSRSQELFE